MRSKYSLFLGYLFRISNYLERITFHDSTHMINMTYHIIISLEILRIDNGCSLEKEFIKGRLG